MSKLAASGNGFFSAMIAMLWVFGMRLVTATGTIAPFSAMSGAVMMMSLLSIRPLAPQSLQGFGNGFGFKSIFVPGGSPGNSGFEQSCGGRNKKCTATACKLQK
jgi:hypothetical protein